MLYPIAIVRGNTTEAHSIYVPDIKGCFSAADSYQKVFDNAMEAIELHLEGLVDDGEAMPLPSTIDAYIDNEKYQGMTWALIPIDTTNKCRILVQLSVSLVHYSSR